MPPSRAQHPRRSTTATVPAALPRPVRAAVPVPDPTPGPGPDPWPDPWPDDALCAAACEVDVIDQAKVARARAALPATSTVGALAETFRALGDPTRLLIVNALAHEELCVCDLASLAGVSQSAVSHSLRVLRDLRLVRFRKVGKIAYYALDDAHIVTLLGEGRRHVEELDTRAGPRGGEVKP